MEIVDLLMLCVLCLIFGFFIGLAVGCDNPKKKKTFKYKSFSQQEMERKITDGGSNYNSFK